MATFTEFYCDCDNTNSVASNTNAGSDVPGTGPSMTDTAFTGSWTSTTKVYVSTVTNGSVAVGQFIAIFQSGATVPITIARITAVSGGGGSAWTITVSNTSYAGTQPGSLTTNTNYGAKVGGCWLGPNGSSSFPTSLGNLDVLTDSSTNPIRINYKKGSSPGKYAITSGMTTSSTGNNGAVTNQGMTSTAGDGGRAIIDGGSSTIVLLTASQSNWIWRDLVFQNNGASGNNNGLAMNGSREVLERVTVNTVRGFGIRLGGDHILCIECEAYACNGSNTGTQGGWSINGNCDSLVRCTAHHNTGTNSLGFYMNAGCTLSECIAAANQSHGFYAESNFGFLLRGCLAYGNGTGGTTGHGYFAHGSGSRHVLDSCHWVNSSGAGVENFAVNNTIEMLNNGDYNNTSGRTAVTAPGVTGAFMDVGAISYASNPCTDGANGDFSISLSTAKAAGRGNFLLDSSQYSKSSTSYPDVGPVQTSSALGSTIVLNQNITQYIVSEGDY